jgi:hypothetical protein
LRTLLADWDKQKMSEKMERKPFLSPFFDLEEAGFPLKSLLKENVEGKSRFLKRVKGVSE